jgi:hypothetical protein
MTTVQSNGRGTGGVTGKGFRPGRSGNPGGRPCRLPRQHGSWSARTVGCQARLGDLALARSAVTSCPHHLTSRVAKVSAALDQRRRPLQRCLTDLLACRIAGPSRPSRTAVCKPPPLEPRPGRGGRTPAGRTSASPHSPGQSRRYPANCPLPCRSLGHGRQHPQRLVVRRAAER